MRLSNVGAVANGAGWRYTRCHMYLLLTSIFKCVVRYSELRAARREITLEHKKVHAAKEFFFCLQLKRLDRASQKEMRV